MDSNQRSGPQAAAFPGQSILSDPMSNLAMAYGSSLASQGREMMDKNVSVGFGDVVPPQEELLGLLNPGGTPGLNPT